MLQEEIWTPQSSAELSEKIQWLCEKLGTQWQKEGYVDEATRLKAVVEEAALNAWIHGNQEKPMSRLTIRWRFDRNFKLEVIDEGDGFDHHEIPDPTTCENLTKPCGRGIFIMKYFSQDVRWKEGGRHIIVTFDKNI